MRDTLQRFNRNLLICNLSKGYKVRRAHEPVDIFWENFGLTKT